MKFNATLRGQLKRSEKQITDAMVIWSNSWFWRCSARPLINTTLILNRTAGSTEIDSGWQSSCVWYPTETRNKPQFSPKIFRARHVGIHIPRCGAKGIRLGDTTPGTKERQLYMNPPSGISRGAHELHWLRVLCEHTHTWDMLLWDKRLPRNL